MAELVSYRLESKSLWVLMVPTVMQTTNSMGKINNRELSLNQKNILDYETFQIWYFVMIRDKLVF